jgi:hyperosmotically inducible periplasmic protein
MKKLFLVTALGLAVAGCNSGTKSGSGSGTARDNTAVNERDRGSAAKTPIDQNENEKDTNITAEIRKRVVDTKMSIDAQNVKIITQNGRVTLRGPVKTAEEKKQIETFAQEVAGAGNVDSQIEIEPAR